MQLRTSLWLFYIKALNGMEAVACSKLRLLSGSVRQNGPILLLAETKKTYELHPRLQHFHILGD